MTAPIGHTQLSGSTVPQHATFAHSKEDVLNALSFYFGQPTSPEKLKDYNEHHAATCKRRHIHPCPSQTVYAITHGGSRMRRRISFTQTRTPRLPIAGGEQVR